MARTVATKDIKPKIDTVSQFTYNHFGGGKFILINAGVTIFIMIIFLAIIYLLPPGGITQPAINPDEKTESVLFFVYNLDEFVINLNNPGEKRYLKSLVSLNITRDKNEPSMRPEDKMAVKKTGAHASGDPSDAAEAYYAADMKIYKMEIRDVIISKLSSLTAEELSSITGKQQAKDDIKDELNRILPPDRQVDKVNFAEFLIQ